MKYIKNSFKNMVPYHSSLITDGIILNANESPYNPPKEVIDLFKKELNSFANILDNHSDRIWNLESKLGII